MITLLHPSRGRPEMAFETYHKWLAKAENKNFEYILGIDESDKTKNKYQELFINEGKRCTIHEGHNNSLVDATNKIASMATGDILIYLSDDFDCPQLWDRMISDRMDVSKPQLLKVDDCLQEFNNVVLTIPIMTRKLYTELGFFWHPEYKSQWVDVDLYYRCEKYLIKAEDLKFQHLHYSNLHIEPDKTYRENEGNWKQGLDVLNKQLELMGLPVRFDQEGSKRFDTR